MLYQELGSSSNGKSNLALFHRNRFLHLRFPILEQARQKLNTSRSQRVEDSGEPVDCFSSYVLGKRRLV